MAKVSMGATPHEPASASQASGFDGDEEYKNEHTCWCRE
jgi:hypothetical protein